MRIPASPLSIILAGLLLLISSAAEAGGSNMWAQDCRYARTPLIEATEGSDGFEHLAFPRDDVFRPLAAAPLEPRFFGNYGGSQLDPNLGEDGTFHRFVSIHVGLAGGAGIWGWRDRRTCDGFQLNIFGGAYSYFAINYGALVNTDFQGVVTATTSWSNYSARLRVFHQSTHLGDDFLFANREHPAEKLSFEVVELLGSVDGPWWRAYAGGGHFVRADPRDLGRIFFQAGVEIRSEGWEFQGPIPTMQWAPIAGADIVSHQARDWGLTTNTILGAELTGADHRRRFRLLATLLYGYAPIGVFFDRHRMTSIGLQTQFVY